MGEIVIVRWFLRRISNIAEYVMNNVTGMFIITIVYIAVLATWMLLYHNYTFYTFLTNQRGNIMTSIFAGIATGIITGYIITLYFNKRDEESAKREKEKEIKRSFKWHMDEAWKHLNEMNVNLTAYIQLLEISGGNEQSIQKLLVVRDIRLTDTRIDENIKKLREFEIIANDNIKEKFNSLYDALLNVKIEVVIAIFPEHDTRNVSVRDKFTDKDRYKITLEQAKDILGAVNKAVGKFILFGINDYKVEYKKHSEIS